MRSREPRSHIFLRTDIANTLRAIDLANSEYSAANPIAETLAYRAGFVNALRSVAVAFDIELSIAETNRLVIQNGPVSVSSMTGG